MTRKLAPGPLVAATHNAGKVAELKDLFEPVGLQVTSAIDLNLDEPEETELTFVGNALLKARAAATATGKPALSDDSGLAVDALGGAPGIYSARWAGQPRDFGLAMQKVEDALKDAEASSRRAQFICALAVVWPDGHEEVFEGDVTGSLVWPPRGDLGFGYDPMFQADGQDITFGEMDPAKKHAMSHRADAFAKLKAALL
ncbi:MAG: RdgB/HAM1 family non-canonical purine NTP pyrophosphatase [Pseudomonadota bacterium]